MSAVLILGFEDTFMEGRPSAFAKALADRPWRPQTQCEIHFAQRNDLRGRDGARPSRYEVRNVVAGTGCPPKARRRTEPGPPDTKFGWIPRVIAHSTCPPGGAPNHRGVVPDADYRIKLQVFEGPLDLLLFLIRKNELDIYDIPIESVTKQYVEALRAMQQLDLDVAGEFFVMAASLMEIKSRMLLPKGQHAVDPNATEEEVDPRWELVHQLLQYKKFKEAAGRLAELAETRQNLMERFVSSLSADLDDRPLRSVDRIELWNTFNIVLRRLAEKLVVGEIHDEVVTVSDQMEWILARVRTETSFVFSGLFPGGVSLRRLVATFLAVLELTRLRKLRLRQDEAFSDIICDAVVENPLETPAPTPTVTA